MNSIINQLQYGTGIKNETPVLVIVVCALHAGLHELIHARGVAALKFLRRGNINRVNNNVA